MGGRLKREGIYVQLIYIVVQQKLTQHYKAIILHTHAHTQTPRDRGRVRITSASCASVFSLVYLGGEWSSPPCRSEMQGNELIHTMCLGHCLMGHCSPVNIGKH